MAGRLNRQIVPDVGQHRIVRTGGIGAVHGFTPGNGRHMAQLCTALRQEQIVHAVDAVDVRPFRIVGASPLPDAVSFPDGFTCFRIYGTEIDAVIRPSIVHGSVCIKKQRRINTGKRQRNRL